MRQGSRLERGVAIRDQSRSKEWLGTSAKILLASLATSVAVLVMAEIAFGWRFDPQEISLIVLIILAIMTFGARLRARRKEKNNHAKT